PGDRLPELKLIRRPRRVHELCDGCSAPVLQIGSGSSHPAERGPHQLDTKLPTAGRYSRRRNASSLNSSSCTICRVSASLAVRSASSKLIVGAERIRSL